MRTSKGASHSGMGAITQVFIAGALAGIGLIATTAPVSLQDIASLANIRTSDANRWFAHIISIPTGSEHGSIQEGKNLASIKIIHTMGVQTSEDIHVLGRNRVVVTGGLTTINRTLKGDRVYQPKIAQVSPSTKRLLKSNSIITGSVIAPKAATNNLVAMAQTFTQTLPWNQVANTKAKDAGAKNQRKTNAPLNHARAAAQQLASAQAKPNRKEIAMAAHPALGAKASSYAPESAALSNAASAFAAVLRPALVKPAPQQVTIPSARPRTAKPTKKAKKKSGFKRAVAALKRYKKRSIIRLAKGDHKWAAKALPRNSFSRSQRRCLAIGVYFEARSESKKGQQAVAQVILNRVKNPTYPNSVCGVVYQNKWKRNACQFSFACDGKRDRVNSKKHWRKSVKVANDAIDGRVWLRKVGSSSHYHADYVWPRWRKSMRKMVKIGRHIFYRTYGGGWS